MAFAFGSAALALALLVPAAAGRPDEPLACDFHALNRAERDRHAFLSDRIKAAAVHVRELTNGYAITLDLSRLPADVQGAPFCVVEVAEWVDLESRCCPFLDFAIATSGRVGNVPSHDGRRNVVLSLTGGAKVKAFLKTEFPLLEKPAQ